MEFHILRQVIDELAGILPERGWNEYSREMMEWKYIFSSIGNARTWSSPFS